MTNYTLTIESGPLQGQQYPIDKDVCTVGRDAASDLSLNDNSVSRHHARIIRRGTEILLEDMGSLNGTSINETLINQPTLLVPGDRLRFGLHITMRFDRVAEAEALPAIAPAARKKSDTKRIHKAGPAPFSLLIRGGKQAGQVFPLVEGSHPVGRAPDNPVLLTNEDISSHHAVVHVREEGVWIEDLGSANGTYVNNGVISGPTQIRPGDALQLGTTVVLEVHSGVALRA